MSPTKSKPPPRNLPLGKTDKIFITSLKSESKLLKSFDRLLNANDEDLREITIQGISSEIVIHFIEKLKVTRPQFAEYIGVSRATLDRKIQDHQVLDLVHSDRVIRYTHLWKLAVHLWGSDKAARQWLRSPEAALGGATPLQHAITEIGSRQVEDLMGQIAHGIVS